MTHLKCPACELLKPDSKKETFVILMDPVPLLRVKFGNGRAYTPAKSANAKKAIALNLAANLDKNFKINETPVFAGFRFYFKPPKRPKFKLHGVKPDLTNLTKLVEDAANGILWHDDALLCVIGLGKFYDWVGPPRIEIDVIVP